MLENLKKAWNEDLTEEQRNEYKLLELPSPMVVTTKQQDSDDVTMKLTIQNFKLTLFKEPGFFKFCHIKVNQLLGESSVFIGEDRALGTSSAKAFMKSRPFTVLDYKLKTMAGGRYAGTPMGLFLLDDHQNPGYTVCAHIHFQLSGNTLNHQRINLVHHKKSRRGIRPILYPWIEEGAKVQINPSDADAQALVQACYAYVENNKPGTWNNVSLWNMTGFGVSGLFRVQDLRNQRSTWEDSYLKHIEKFDLPKAASTSE